MCRCEFELQSLEYGVGCRYNEIQKKVERFPLVYDLLSFLAAKGSVTLFNALPIVKAQLAVTINAFGATPRRKDPLSAKELTELARVFTLLLTVSAPCPAPSCSGRRAARPAPESVRAAAHAQPLRRLHRAERVLGGGAGEWVLHGKCLL